MKKKIYSSYDEIDRDMEILNLERKLHYYKVKQSIEDLKEHLTLPNLAQGLLSFSADAGKPLVKNVFKMALPFFISRIFRSFRK